MHWDARGGQLLPRLTLRAPPVAGPRPMQDLEALLFDDAGSGGAFSLSSQGLFASCSAGRARFSRDNVLVLGPVPLACRWAVGRL